MIKKNINAGILYISVLKNGGGKILLNQMLAAALFPHEYPIFARYRQPKSEMADILLNNAAKIYSVFIYEYLSLRLLR